MSDAHSADDPMATGQAADPAPTPAPVGNNFFDNMPAECLNNILDALPVKVLSAFHETSQGNLGTVNQYAVHGTTSGCSVSS